MAKVKEIKQNLDRVTVELGGKERVLQFDLNAFAELENKYGSIEEAMNKLMDGKMGDIRTILWAGLIHEEVVVDEVTGEPIKYNITPYTVGSWITRPAMLQDVSAKIAEALGNSMPQADEIDDEIAKKLAEQGFKMGPNGLEKIEDSKND